MTNKKYKIQHERSYEMLIRFGLTQNEAKIYIYLIERGTPLGGSKIALGTGIHRQYVYICLLRLVELGLVESVMSGKQNKYKGVSQSQIEKIARRRVSDAEELVRELDTFSAVGHEQDFEVYQGGRELQNFEIDFARKISEGDVQYVIGGAADYFYDAMEDRYGEFVEIIKNKKFITHYIGPKEELNALMKAKNAHPGFIYKTIPGFPKGITNTVIRDGSIAIYTFANPPLVYVIKSKITAENYKKYFDMLWKLAE